MLAQGQSSSAKRGRLVADVSSGLIFLKKQTNKQKKHHKITKPCPWFVSEYHQDSCIPFPEDAPWRGGGDLRGTLGRCLCVCRPTGLLSKRLPGHRGRLSAHGEDGPCRLLHLTRLGPAADVLRAWEFAAPRSSPPCHEWAGLGPGPGC